MKKFLCVVAAIFVAETVSAQVTMTGGISGSVNMGASRGANIGLRAERRGKVGFENIVFFDSSKKRDGGWRVGDRFSLRFGRRTGLVIGADFRHRDGGIWYKQTIWALSGVSWQSEHNEVRLTYQHPIYEDSQNLVRSVELDMYARFPNSRFGVWVMEDLNFYRDYAGQPTRIGWSQMAGVSVRLNKPKS